MSAEGNFRIEMLLVLFIVVPACSSAPNQSMRFNARVEHTSDIDKIKLQFAFSSATKQVILIDWDALSVYNPQYEEDSLINVSDLNGTINSIHHSQFVIENKSNQRRLFSDVILFEGETMEMKSAFPVGNNIDTLNLEANKPSLVRSAPIIVNRLKVSETDKTIRLHYLFKPTDEQKRNGFKQLILTSNWFEL